MAHPLDSARLKVHRARGHLEALDIERKRFTDTNPFRLVVEPDLATGEDVVRFRCDEPIRVPLVLGLIAGDAIHNLRSALDHVVYQLALAGGGDGDRTQFPIFEDGHAYADHVGRLLEGVPEDERSKIKELQPFRARTLIEAGAAPPTTARDPLAVNMYLMFLGRLDNLDKHRLPLPGGVLVPFRQPSFEGVARARVRNHAPWLRVADGGEYCRISDLELLPGVTEAKVSSDFPYTIAFGDPEWNPIGQPNDVWVDRSKGAATRADLGIIAEFVDQIIIMFDPVLESAPASPSGL